MPKPLAVPRVIQRHQYDCGDACKVALLRFHRLPAPRGTAADPAHGLPPDAVASVLRQAGLRVLAGPMTLSDLRHLTATGRPVLCPVSLKGGHWVVAAGVWRGRVHYHCPADGPGAMPAADWLAGWSDVCWQGTRYDRWGVCGWPAWMDGLAG